MHPCGGYGVPPSNTNIDRPLMKQLESAAPLATPQIKGMDRGVYTARRRW